MAATAGTKEAKRAVLMNSSRTRWRNSTGNPEQLEDRRKAGENGAPGEIRTPDPLLRRQMLYPAELRARPITLPNSAVKRPEFEGFVAWNIEGGHGAPTTA